MAVINGVICTLLLDHTSHPIDAWLVTHTNYCCSELEPAGCQVKEYLTSEISLVLKRKDALRPSSIVNLLRLPLNDEHSHNNNTHKLYSVFVYYCVFYPGPH